MDLSRSDKGEAEKSKTRVNFWFDKEIPELSITANENILMILYQLKSRKLARLVHSELFIWITFADLLTYC